MSRATGGARPWNEGAGRVGQRHLPRPPTSALIDAPRQSNFRLRASFFVAIITTATTPDSHPDCRALLIQIVALQAVKPTNKAGQPAAELAEPRAGAEGNVSQQSTGRAQYRGTVSQALARIRQAARQRKKEKFTALFHHVSIAHLAEAFSELKENAAAGVDGLTCRDYEQHLERNLEDLHARVHRGAYRALPSRRVYIPKPDGRQRPIAVAALEDKNVQRATAAVLSPI